MKNGDINNYGIKNPDGKTQSYFNDGKTSYGNDSKRFVKENPMSMQSEWDASALESTVQPVGKTAAELSGPNVTSEAVSKASSSIKASLTSALGGSATSLVTVVATTVVTAAIVVATFVSMLTINVSLLIADMTRLVFGLEMKGVQEEDYQTTIHATLQGEDFFFEQQITPDSTFLTFEGLQPGKEYLLRIFNDEKVFVEQTYVTASSYEEKGFLEASYDGNELFFCASVRNLKKGEFYTITAKSDKGKVIYSVDDVVEQKEGRVLLDDETKSVSLSLTVGGKTYAVSQVTVGREPEPIEPEYDLENPECVWSGYSAATFYFEDLNGGSPLALIAEITEDEVSTPTCEEDGLIVYTANASFGGQSFSDKKEVVLSSLGHEYVFSTFEWTEPGDTATTSAVTSDGPEEIGYGAVAVFVCSHDSEHVLKIDAEIDTAVVSPTCESDGKTTYTASVEYSDVVYEDAKESVEPRLGHEYVFSTFEWTFPEDTARTSEDSSSEEPVCTAVAVFVCTHDSAHVLKIDAEIETSVDSPTCEDDGKTTYTASVEYSGEPYEDFKEIVVSSLGHDLELNESTATCEEPGEISYYECSRCHKLFDLKENEITAEDLATEAVGHKYSDHVFHPLSCRTYGEVVKVCSACGKLEYEVVDADENHHSFIQSQLTDDYVTCDLCGLQIPVNVLNTDNQTLSIYQNGYFIGNDDMVNTENTYYYLSGSFVGDSIDVYTSSYVDEGTGGKAVFHFIFDGISVTAGDGDSSGFITLYVDRDVDIFITELSESYITTKFKPAVYVKALDENSDEKYTVNLYISSEQGFETIVFSTDDPDLDHTFPVIDFEDADRFVCLTYMNYTLFRQYDVNTLEKGVIRPYYIVMFYVDESPTDVVFVQDGDSLQDYDYPATPEKAGYVFEGWYTDPEFASPLNPADTISENVGIYSYWTEEHEHVLGDLYSEEPASCEYPGLEAHYRCSVCYKYFDAEGNLTTYDDLVIPAPGHDYGDLIAENFSNNGLYEHYCCSVCGKFFDTEYNEVLLEDLTIPVSSDPVLLTSDDLLQDMVGMNVVLKTVDGTCGVKIGNPNNTSEDTSDLSLLTIESISDGQVVLFYETEENYLSVTPEETVDFSSSSPNALTVSSEGYLVVRGYYLKYDDSGAKGIYLTENGGTYVVMYLIP